MIPILANERLKHQSEQSATMNHAQVLDLDLALVPNLEAVGPDQGLHQSLDLDPAPDPVHAPVVKTRGGPGLDLQVAQAQGQVLEAKVLANPVVGLVPNPVVKEAIDQNLQVLLQVAILGLEVEHRNRAVKHPGLDQEVELCALEAAVLLDQDLVRMQAEPRALPSRNMVLFLLKFFTTVLFVCEQIVYF